MDSPEDCMVHVLSVRPDPALRPFLHLYVQREASLGGVELIEPVVARLGVKVEFKFAGLYEIRTYSGDFHVRPNRISLIGPQTFRRVRLTLRGRVESLAIIFQPCGFHALFETPTNYLADISREGHAVLGKDISQLYEQLGNLRTFSERTDLLNAYFLQCLCKMKSCSPVCDALHRLAARRDFAISDAVQQTGLSRRQFERQSLVYAGMPPNNVTRIARFNKALQLSRRASLTWTEIAQEAGYYDHMHLVRDFHAFAGQSPTVTQREIAPDHLVNFCAPHAGVLHPNG